MKGKRSLKYLVSVAMCCYEVAIARERPIRERKKVYERRKRLYILRMVACLFRISTAELII